MNDWLINLKAGDTVIFDYNGNKRVEKVEKITSKGRIKVAGCLFNQEGYYCARDSYHGSWIHEATPEAIQSIHDADMVTKTVRRVDKYVRDFTALSVDQWRRIKAILDEGEQK